MSLFKQALLDTHDEMVVDLFAGGGGASSGIEQALGRMVDVAINHDRTAVELHRANHPQTEHFVSDVFEVDTRIVCQGRPVGLLWASPDCTYHSKARGGKPIRDANKKRRALAWVVTRWAGQVRPRVIFLENVEEFAQWGPLRGPKDDLRPCPKRKGQTFKKWVKSLTDLGYVVEWKELRACDYGAPTIRKRLFLIARCDGQPIAWPTPTHADPKSKTFKEKKLKPWRAVSECIDWSIPMLSIFATKEEAKAWATLHGQATPIRPLADKTMQRIARGVKRYVLDNPKPFLVSTAFGEGSGPTKRWSDGTSDTSKPMATVTTKAEQCLVAANLVSYHDHSNPKDARSAGMDAPVHVIDTANRHGLVASFLAQNNGGNNDMDGRNVAEPLATVLANGSGHHGLIAAHLQQDYGCSIGSDPVEPARTVTSGGGGHANLVASFLLKYYGTNIGHGVDEPIHTVTSGAQHHGLVTVEIGKQTFLVDDIAMRMLQPKELYLAQGFRPGYIIDRTADGTKITKTEQVKMCGNSVSPPCAEALVRANCPDMIVRRVEKAS